VQRQGRWDLGDDLATEAAGIEPPEHSEGSDLMPRWWGFGLVVVLLVLALVTGPAVVCLGYGCRW
jgi:hypothetical protein